MKYQILLSQSEDTKAVEGQEQARFIKSILEALDVPIEYDPDQPPTIEERQRLRKAFREFNIHVINDVEGGVKIYIGDDLIAEWYKSTYKLKRDLSQKDPRDRIYLEMNISIWSIFEDDKENEMQS